MLSNCRSRGGSSVSGVLDFLLFSLAPTIFNIAGSFSVLASHFGPELICIIGITGVLYIAVMEVSRSKTVALGRECRQRSDNTAAIKNEGISNVELLKYLGMEAYEVNRYSNSLVGLQKAEWESGLYDHAAELLQNSIQVAGKAHVWISFNPAEYYLTGTLMGSAWVADQVYEDKINVGIFVMYLTYASSILGNCEPFRTSSCGPVF